VQAKPDMVRQAVAAAVEATQISGSNKDQNTGVMVKELKLSPEVASKLYDEAKELSLWQTDGRATRAGMSFVFQMDQAALKLHTAPTESQIFDWSFLPK